MKLDRRSLFSFALLLVAGPCLARSGPKASAMATTTLLSSSVTPGGTVTIAQTLPAGPPVGPPSYGNYTVIAIGQSTVGLETKNWSLSSNARGDVKITLKNTSTTPKAISATFVCYAGASGNDGGDAVSTSLISGVVTAATANSSSGTFESESQAREVSIDTEQFLQPGEKWDISGVNTINTFVPSQGGPIGVGGGL